MNEEYKKLQEAYQKVISESTSSNIGIIYPDRKIKAIYVHFDGYPDGVGKIIKDNYKTLKDAESIVALGDLSGLGTDLTAANGTEAYGRDRKEKGTEAITFKDKPSFMKDRQSFAYLFDVKQDKWIMIDSNGALKTLEKV